MRLFVRAKAVMLLTTKAFEEESNVLALDLLDSRT